jgi:hypothetical protein
MNNRTCTKSALGFAAAGLLMCALVQPHAAEPHHTVVPADAVKWGPAPASLPPGAQGAVRHYRERIR